MTDQESDERSENASKEFDVPSPYEDYSNMLNNFNSDSDLMQTPSPSPPPDLVQNLNFWGNHAVNEHSVNLQQSTDQIVSCTKGKLIKSFI